MLWLFTSFYDHASHIVFSCFVKFKKALTCSLLKTICLDFSETNIFALGTTSSLHDRLVKPQGLRWSPWIQRHVMSSKTWWTTSVWEAKQKTVEQSQGFDFVSRKKMGNGLITLHIFVFSLEGRWVASIMHVFGCWLLGCVVFFGYPCHAQG